MGLTQEIGPRRVPNPRSRLSLDVGTDHFLLEIKLRPKASNLLWGVDGLGLNNINNKNIKHLNPLKNKTNRNKFREIYSDYLFKSQLISIQIGKRENSKNYKILYQFKYKIKPSKILFLMRSLLLRAPGKDSKQWKHHQK